MQVVGAPLTSYPLLLIPYFSPLTAPYVLPRTYCPHSLLKAHPFFGRINWERLHAKQMTSPLRAPIEAMLASRAVGGHKPKHALNSADQDMAPSYLSQQHSALVQGWDYVGDSK